MSARVVYAHQRVELLPALRAYGEVLRDSRKLRGRLLPILERLEQDTHMLQELVTVEFVGLSVRKEPEERSKLLSCGRHPAFSISHSRTSASLKPASFKARRSFFRVS